MQILCEAYSLLKDILGCSCDEMGEIFEDWNKNELDSFLVEITVELNLNLYLSPRSVISLNLKMKMELLLLKRFAILLVK